MAGKFDFQDRSNPSDLARLLQNKRQIEANIEAQERKERNSRVQRLLEAVKTGQEIAGNMMSLAENRKKLQDRKKISGILSEPGKDSVVGSRQVREPLPEGVQGPEAITDTPITFGETREGQTQEQRLNAAMAEAFPEKFVDSRLKAATPKGTPPRSVQGIFVDQFNKGVIDESQLKSKLQEFSPDISIIELPEGGKAVFDARDKSITPITGPQPAGAEGKQKRVQFTPEENKAIVSARKQFNDSEFVKKQGAVLKEVDKINELIKKNPKGAIGPIRTQVSKIIAGEIGRLTNEDIERNIPTQDIGPALQQWMRTRTQADLTQISRDRYLKLINIVQKKLAGSLDKELSSIVDDVASFDTVNADRGTLRQTIGRGTTKFIDEFIEKEEDDPLKKFGLSMDAIQKEKVRRGLK